MVGIRYSKVWHSQISVLTCSLLFILRTSINIFSPTIIIRHDNLTNTAYTLPSCTILPLDTAGYIFYCYWYWYQCWSATNITDFSIVWWRWIISLLCRRGSCVDIFRACVRRLADPLYTGERERVWCGSCLPTAAPVHKSFGSLNIRSHRLHNNYRCVSAMLKMPQQIFPVTGLWLYVVLLTNLTN